MDALTIYSAYMTGVVALVGLWSIRAPDENLRIVVLLAIFWPLSVVAIVSMFLMNATGWTVDVAKGTKLFGFRRPTNPQARGFALTAFGTEFQFYAVKG